MKVNHRKSISTPGMTRAPKLPEIAATGWDEPFSTENFPVSDPTPPPDLKPRMESPKTERERLSYWLESAALVCEKRVLAWEMAHKDPSQSLPNRRYYQGCIETAQHLAADIRRLKP